MAWVLAQAEATGISRSAVVAGTVAESRRREENPDRLAELEAELARLGEEFARVSGLA
jgi:hypothetical protein